VRSVAGHPNARRGRPSRVQREHLEFALQLLLHAQELEPQCPGAGDKWVGRPWPTPIASSTRSSAFAACSATRNGVLEDLALAVRQPGGEHRSPVQVPVGRPTYDLSVRARTRKERTMTLPPDLTTRTRWSTPKELPVLAKTGW
jgi:hypothetical protein